MSDRAPSIRIPVYAPALEGNEKRYVDECLDSSWISSRGVFVERFEREFAARIGVPRATSVCNGTVALHLALVALGLAPGDEVLVPTFTYIASVNTIVQAGARPVFVDSLPTTWQVDPADLQRKLTARTRAIMAVHLYGHACDMEAIGRLCRDNGLMLIEDCAEAFGTRFDGRHVGTFGDVATFSFFGNKTITTGEGGMVVCRDVALHERCAHLKNQGISPVHEYWHDEPAFNYRMTNVCAAIGTAQLERADSIISAKRSIAAWYDEALHGAPVVLHREADPRVVHSYWMNSILVPEAGQREPLRRHLAATGIETRPTFPPAHLMPMYRGVGERHPVAEDLGARGINLPSGSKLTQQQVIEISREVRGYFDA
jgi:perosamine synthetase